jgi:glutamyl-tRNA reductase
LNRYRIVTSKYFVVAGISHKEADLQVRERFSLSEERIHQLIERYKAAGGESIFVLSTCNRTELYALSDSPENIQSLFMEHCRATAEDAERYCYLRTNNDAIQHLFQVAVGMDSQILGDFEIIGQLKKAFRIAKTMHATNAFTERLINTVSQCSKEVKNRTEFSSGAASTSFAAVNFIRQHISDFEQKNVLLFGTGKIGQHVCENLVKHLPGVSIIAVNRSEEKASKLAEKHDITLGKIGDLLPLIDAADIVIVSTGAQDPTILPGMIPGTKDKYFIDLSMPRNVAPEVKKCPNTRVVYLDELANVADETLLRRKAELQTVEEIIAYYHSEFEEWLESRKYVPTITAIKEKLEYIQQSEVRRYKKENKHLDEVHLNKISSDIIQKITNQLSTQLKGFPAENMEMVHQLFKIDTENR